LAGNGATAATSAPKVYVERILAGEVGERFAEAAPSVLRLVGSDTVLNVKRQAAKSRIEGDTEQCLAARAGESAALKVDD
jgi:hypothetical protein